jgi:glycerol kinase
VSVVVAIDAGTTGVRAFAVDETGAPVGWSYREFAQHFPQPGWVEHDPMDIWAAVEATLAELRARLAEAGHTIAAIGITDQRETTVVWSRSTGKPLANAIVWQDRRTAARCDELRDTGMLPLVRSRTGLVLDPYFSATKLEWLLRSGDVDRGSDLAFGTVDSWVLWNLTGGAVHATDPSNASRTMLCDITSASWDDELCALFDVPASCLPEIRPSSGRLGVTADGIPVSAIAGDQQSALFGQACFAPGTAKNTYGTGSFVLMNVGDSCPPPVDGLLTTVAWQMADGSLTYALEGAIFVTGAAVQWLRDGLGIIEDAAETEDLAASITDTEGVFIVPAFTGLGSPHWDPYARGAVFGLTRGAGRAHLARAVLESMAYQTRDVVESMRDAAGREITALRADGGAAANNVLLQIQADQLQVPVARPAVAETTALGAAYLAGIAEGVWSSPDEVAQLWRVDREFTPTMPPSVADAKHAQWKRAVDRTRAFSS